MLDRLSSCTLLVRVTRFQQNLACYRPCIICIVFSRSPVIADITPPLTASLVLSGVLYFRCCSHQYRLCTLLFRRSFGYSSRYSNQLRHLQLPSLRLGIIYIAILGVLLFIYPQTKESIDCSSGLQNFGFTASLSQSETDRATS